MSGFRNYAVRANPPFNKVEVVEVAEVGDAFTSPEFPYGQIVEGVASPEAAAFMAGESYAASTLALPLIRLIRRLRSEFCEITPEDIGYDPNQVEALRLLLKQEGGCDPFEGMQWSGTSWVGLP